MILPKLNQVTSTTRGQVASGKTPFIPISRRLLLRRTGTTIALSKLSSQSRPPWVEASREQPEHASKANQQHDPVGPAS